MAKHGGQRLGSGRKAGSSMLEIDRRLSVAALKRGVEMAGAGLGLPVGPELYAETVARIAHDEVRKGNGWAVVMKIDEMESKVKPEEGKPSSGSGLIDALSKLPGFVARDTGATLAAPDDGHDSSVAGDTGDGTTAPQFVAPVNGGAPGAFFDPQSRLDLDVIDLECESFSRETAASGRPAGGRAGAPYPPRGAAPAMIHPRTENFEKSGPGADPSAVVSGHHEF